MSQLLSSHDIGLITIAEAAQIAGLPVATIRVWVVRYQLPATRVLGQVMLSERAFLACERERRNSPQRRVYRKTFPGALTSV